MNRSKYNIPKIIHLTWFSGEEYPDHLKKCIDTWERILPDFKIKLWTMDMARNLNIQYINEALDAKKWAFASDVVRAYAVWKYGGIYMDTDIWLFKRFDDLLNNHIVFFIETNDKYWKNYNPKDVLTDDGLCLDPNWFVLGRQIQAAIFMAEKGHPCLAEIINFYKERSFLDKNGNPNINIISPSIYAKVLERYGFRYTDKEQHLKNDITVYPSSYISYTLYERKKNTIAAHLAKHSWNPRTPFQEFKYKIRMSILGGFLYKIYKKIAY